MIEWTEAAIEARAKWKKHPNTVHDPWGIKFIKEDRLMKENGK